MYICNEVVYMLRRLRLVCGRVSASVGLWHGLWSQALSRSHLVASQLIFRSVRSNTLLNHFVIVLNS